MDVATKPIPSSRRVGRISASTSRVHSEYSVCTAAIVPREHGIPGTEKGARILTDGQRVLVDADQGIVVPIGSGDIADAPL
jgi:phosphohistidine swiveling domain-containing protein